LGFLKIRLILVGAIIVLALLYWVGTTVYNQFIASEYNVKLPFVNEYKKDIYITNVNAAKDPTFDQLLTFLKNDKTDEAVVQNPASALGEGITQLHNNAEKAGIRCGVVELQVSGSSTVYALNVFNTVDKGYVWVDCSGDPYEVGPESIVHMDSKELHTMVFTPIEDAPASFLRDMGNMSECYALETCEANIKSYTW
jgi:hypothetical protein